MSQLQDVFRENVRERMHALGITQADLADLMGVTPSFVSQILSNHRSAGFESVEKFAKALDCEAIVLLQKVSKKSKKAAKSA